MSEDKNQEFINFYIKTISHLPLAEKSYVVILAGWLFASMFLSNSDGNLIYGFMAEGEAAKVGLSATS